MDEAEATRVGADPASVVEATKMTDRTLVEIMDSDEYKRASLLTLERVAPAIGSVLETLSAEGIGSEVTHGMANELLKLAAWLAEASGFCGPGDEIREGRWLEMAEDAWTDRPPQAPWPGLTN